MIETLLKLGISGSEIVASRLKKIQKERDNLVKKPSIFKMSTFSSIQNMFKGKPKEEPYFEPGGKPETTKTPPSEEKKSSPTTDRSRELKGAASQAGSAVGSLDGTALAQAAIKGVSALGGPIGMMAGKVANDIVDAATTFRDTVKNSAGLYADTMDAKNTAIRFAGEDFADYIVSGRRDVDRNTQRAIVSSLGSQYGKFSAEFRNQIENLFTGKVRGKTSDLGETTQLAQGNFKALGTDRGFFMQKIADSLGDLPPSMMQKMMGQLIQAVPESERSTQTDALTSAKANTTFFDDSARNKAASFSSKGNMDLAKSIQSLTDTLDTKLAGGINSLILKIEGMAKANSPTDYVLTELKSAILDLKSMFAGMVKGSFL